MPRPPDPRNTPAKIIIRPQKPQTPQPSVPRGDGLRVTLEPNPPALSRTAEPAAPPPSPALTPTPSLTPSPAPDSTAQVRASFEPVPDAQPAPVEKPASSARQHHVRTPFADVRPKVVSVCCSDGRYIDAIEEFLFAQGIDCHDILAFPGGPARLCMENASIFEVSFATESLEMLAISHQSQRVLLVSHADCGFYRQRYSVCDPERQKNDLRQARERIRARVPQLNVQCFWAGPSSGKPDDGFTIEEVD